MALVELLGHSMAPWHSGVKVVGLSAGAVFKLGDFLFHKLDFEQILVKVSVFVERFKLNIVLKINCSPVMGNRLGQEALRHQSTRSQGTRLQGHSEATSSVSDF